MCPVISNAVVLWPIITYVICSSMPMLESQPERGGIIMPSISVSSENAERVQNALNFFRTPRDTSKKSGP